MQQHLSVRFAGSCLRRTRILPLFFVAGWACTVFAICGMPSHATAQNNVGTWQLQKIESVNSWTGRDPGNPETQTWEPGKRGPFSVGWTVRKRGEADRKVYLSVLLPELPQTLRLGDWLSFDATITAWFEGPGPDLVYVKFNDEAITSSGHAERGLHSMVHKVAAGKKDEFVEAVRNTQLIGTFPREDFTFSLRVSIEDRYRRDDYPESANVTIHLHYKWRGGSNDVGPLVGERGAVSGVPARRVPAGAEATLPGLPARLTNDPAALSTDPALHAAVTRGRTAATLKISLSEKVAALDDYLARNNPDRRRELFTAISLLVAKHVPTAECFGGDHGVINPDPREHDGFARQNPGRIAQNLQWKVVTAVGCLQGDRLASFYTDVSVAIAKAARS